MLTFLEGGFNSGVHEELKSIIERKTASGKRCILLVPEQQTVMAEIEMAEDMPSSAPLLFEVSNFTRFANTVFRALGGIKTDYADGVKKSLIMWKTLTELSPHLTLLGGRREVVAGTVERAMSAIKEAEVLGLDAEMMSQAAENEKINRRLKDKLSDLSRIISLYKKNLGEKYSDTQDDLAHVTQKLESNPDFLRETEIFIEGFTSFTAGQYTLLSRLLTITNVTVVLNISKRNSDSFEFSELVRTRQRLISAADKLGTEKKIYKIDGAFGVKSPLLCEIAPILWKSNAKIDNQSLQSKDDLRIFEAKNPFEECEFIASDIKRRVIEGASYRDFAIIASDASKYDGILDTGLDKADIPHFSSYKTDLMSYEAVKLIFAAARACSGFAREDVLEYLSCGLSGISRNECDEFEMYVDKWQIDGSRFTDGVTWNMNPAGFETRCSPDTDKTLARIDATRVKLTVPLLALGEKISGKRSIREHALAIFTFLDSLGVEQQLKERSKKLISLGENALAEENARLFGLICQALDTLVEVLGDCKCDIEAFVSQLKVVFHATQIGKIPAAYDEVMIGSADMIRLSKKKHIYMMGVNYGEFPASESDSAYFLDKDKVALSEIGIELDYDTQARGSRALYSFSRAFSYASETVTLLYSRLDTSFGALTPSLVIGNIEELTGGAIKAQRTETLPPVARLFAPTITSEALGEMKPSERNAAKSALTRCGCSNFAVETSVGNGSLKYSPEDSAKTLYLTQTRIDTFVSCPLQYFCKFTLSLDEGERARFGASSIGSYIHSILENFFSEVKHRSLDTAAISESERDEMIKRAAMRYLSELESELGGAAKTKTALSRLFRAAKPVVDGLCEEFATSKFKPTFFELSISKSSENGPTPVEITGEGGEKIQIYGTIDRVDTMQRDNDVFVRVVDYKTGSKEFKPDDMDKGKNLQMFLYLKSIIECKNEGFKESIGVKKDGRLLPAGLIYVKTDISDQRIATPSDEAAREQIEKSQKRMGMILDDTEIFAAMGERYIPIRLTKNGVYKTSQKYLYSLDGWNDLSRRVEDVVGKIGHRIASGDIKAIRVKSGKDKSPCEWCRYKAFCRSVKQ